jgi:hypothetical protein
LTGNGYVEQRRHANGEPYDVEFETFKNVKDPGKQAAPRFKKPAVALCAEGFFFGGRGRCVESCCPILHPQYKMQAAK